MRRYWWLPCLVAMAVVAGLVFTPRPAPDGSVRTPVQPAKTPTAIELPPEPSAATVPAAGTVDSHLVVQAGEEGAPEPPPAASFAAAPSEYAPFDEENLTDDTRAFLEQFAIAPKSGAGPHAGTLHAANVTNGFDAFFREEHVLVTPAHGDAKGRSFTMRLVGHGRGGIQRDAGTASATLNGKRAEYRRDGLVEWYENRPEGLEQGFDVPSRPAGNGPLRLAFEVAGDLTAVVAPPADRIEFKDESGEDVYWFDKLHAFDARGGTLPARFGWHDGGFEIVVDDDGAAYPITIDPLLSAPGWNFWGSQLGMELGTSVSGAGDVNGDGYNDLIVGAPLYDGPAGEDAGRVYIFHGSPTGFSTTPDLILEGPVAGGRFGETVAGIGDINADGYSEVAVGAPYANEERGMLYVFAGSEAGIDPTPVYQRAGDNPGDRWGWCITAAGDVNGSGYGDFVVTAPGAEGGGSAAVYHGVPGLETLSISTWLNGGEGAVQFGFSCTGGGDLNGSGYSDIAIGDPLFDGIGINGRVHVFYGASMGLHSSEVDVLLPPNSSSLDSYNYWIRFGYALASGGDINGDGLSDLIIGAPATIHLSPVSYDPDRWLTNANSFVFLYYGSVSGISMHPPKHAAHSYAGGMCVAILGDINGDGIADFAVGEPEARGFHDFMNNDYYRTEPSEATVYLGRQHEPTGLHSWAYKYRLKGANADDRFGLQMAGLGDTNGSGFSDMVIAAPRSISSAGRASIFYGQPVTASNEPIVINASGDSGSAGDVNGNGFGDFRIGTDVYHGGPESGAFSSPAWNGPFTPGPRVRIETIGDATGNGYGDLIAINGASSVFYPPWWEYAAAVEVRLYEGGSTGLAVSPDWTVFPWSSYYFSGAHVSFLGDITGQGYSAFLIGAYTNEPSCSNVYFTVISTPAELAAFTTGGSSFDACEPGSDAFDSFGRVSGALGDLTANGRSDYILAGPFQYFGGGVDWSELLFVTEQTHSFTLLPYGFGENIAGIGDVNGDGYDDYCIDAGIHFGGGLVPFTGTADLLLPETPGNYLGDAMRDGYADVLAGNSLYPGGVAGVGQVPIWTAQIEGVARTAGDVNGDGYPDIIISNDTETHIYLGNGGQGVPMLPRQSKVEPLGEPMAAPHARTGSLDSVRLSLMARAPVGRTHVKLQWEIKPHNKPFDGTNLGESDDWVDTGLIPQELAAVAQVPEFANGYRWRVRLLYDPIQNPIHRHSAWYSPVWPYPTSADFRTFIDYEDPTAPGVSLTRVPTDANPDPQAPPTTTDDLLATVSTPSSFHPEVSQEYVFEWSNGLRTWPSNPQPSAATSSTLPAAETRKGESWTCTVRAYDGGNFSDPVVVSKTVINTPPSAPEIAMPPIIGNATNLVCAITTGSVDPDNDPITYAFAWFVKRSGETAFSPFAEAVDDPVNRLSLVDSGFTQPGDEWYCVVTPSDNEAQGPSASTAAAPTSVVEGGVTPSFIAVDINPETVVLGQSVQLAAEILPNEGSLVSAAKRFDVNPPTGDAFSVPASAESGNRFNATHLPNHASEGQTPWQVTASWAGNSTYSAATSTARSLTVLKAQPTLTVQMLINSGALGLPNVDGTDIIAQVQLSAPLPPELHGLLEGLPVTLNLRDPSGQFRGVVETQGTAGPPIVTDAAGVASFRLQDFVAAGVDFQNSEEDAGTWQLLAEFAGNDNFKTAFSPGYDQPATPRLIIKDGAGYAVIVVGSLPSREGLAEHNKTGDFVYRTLLDRGLGHDEIYYMRQGDPPPFAESNIDASSVSFDAAPSKAGFQQALLWARTRMNESPAPLWVILLDHGLPDEFFIYSGANDLTRLITPQELNGYLTNLESNLSPQARSEGITLVYGACNAGSFIPALSKPGRTIITSARADEKSHRGPRDPVDGIRDGELFTTEFFRGLRVGRNVTQAFQDAAGRVREYTLNSSNFAAGTAPQTPLLDDTGNGIGTPAPQLVYEGNADGARSFGTILGVGLNTGESLSWVESTQSMVLAPGEPVGTLFARSQTPVPDGTTAWLEVKPPTFTGAARVDETDLDNQQEFLDLLSFDHEPGASNMGEGMFRWQSFDGTFDEPGSYSVYFFVRDGNTGETGGHLLAKVFRQTADREPPPSVTLTFPDDGATIGTTNFFAWDPVVDADGNAVTYILEMAALEDTTFDEVLVSREAIVGTFARLTPADGILDGQTYRWRVRPIDAFGMVPATHEVRIVHVDQGNPDAPGSISGRVVRASDSTPIQGASVSVTSGPTQPLPAPRNTIWNGEFAFLNMSPGAHLVRVEAPNFELKANISAFLSSGAGVDLGEIRLQADTGQFTWGDLTGNGIAGTLDAREILRWLNFEINAFPVAPDIIAPAYPPGADVNGSGTLNIADMVAILRRLTGAIDRFPADLNGDGLGPDNAKGRQPLPPKSDEPLRLQIVPRNVPEPRQALVIDITAQHAEGLAGYTLQLEYDSALLAFQAHANTPSTHGWLSGANEFEPGALRFSGGGSQPLSQDGPIATLTFDVLPDTAGLSTHLTVTHADLFTLNGEPYLVEAEPYTLAISGAQHHPADINRDGTVDAVDVQLVINAALGLPIPPYEHLDADVDGDGVVNATDVQRVINYALGI